MQTLMHLAPSSGIGSTSLSLSLSKGCRGMCSVCARYSIRQRKHRGRGKKRPPLARQNPEGDDSIWGICYTSQLLSWSLCDYISSAIFRTSLLAFPCLLTNSVVRLMTHQKSKHKLKIGNKSLSASILSFTAPFLSILNYFNRQLSTKTYRN